MRIKGVVFRRIIITVKQHKFMLPFKSNFKSQQLIEIAI
ncbi:hypothetical protein SAMN05443550_11248 [Pedobacter hartonius]|uniref:Uncharacterized protein n=1 Tax=Pedobacter hartonius TaxID=425514 RepID=A0A1H4H0V6_9SPHI|nr:hypothetical protein SAMN05443550_11248 [Pedobacter hartonius]